MSKAKKAERTLADELSREPSRAEVAARAGVTEARLHALSRTYRLPSSMDAPLRQGSSSQDVRTLEDFVEDDTAVRPSCCNISRKSIFLVNYFSNLYLILDACCNCRTPLTTRRCTSP